MSFLLKAGAAAISSAVGGGGTGSPGVTPIANEVFSAQTYIGDGTSTRKIKAPVQLASKYIAFATLAVSVASSQTIAHPSPGFSGAMTIVLQGSSSYSGAYWSPDNKGGTMSSGQTVQFNYTALGDEQSFTLSQVNPGSSSGYAQLMVVGGANNGKYIRAGSNINSGSYGSAAAAPDHTAENTLPGTVVFSGACRPYNSTISYSDSTSYDPVAPASYGSVTTDVVLTPELTMTLRGSTSPGGIGFGGVNYGHSPKISPGGTEPAPTPGCCVIYFDPATAISNPGGMVIVKRLDTTGDFQIFSSPSNAANCWQSSVVAAQANVPTRGRFFSADGFAVGSDATVNAAGGKYVALMFRKAYKFFDVVRYTGDGATTRAIAHSLGVAPGLVILKNLNSGVNVPVYHKDLGANQELLFSAPNIPGASTTFGNGSAPTDTTLYVGGPTGNSNGNVYEAYLFAHDTSVGNVIQCGWFTVNANRNNIVDIGGEAQLVLTKRTSSSDAWRLYDGAREFGLATMAVIQPNLSTAETLTSGWTSPEPNGFQLSGSGYSASDVIVWMAIKRPTTKPTSGSQVYYGNARTGTSAAATISGIPFSPDTVISTRRASSPAPTFTDRYRGSAAMLQPTATSAEVQANGGITSFTSDGFNVGTNTTWNQNGATHIDWCLKRWPGVFDITSWIGDGSTAGRAIKHNLGVNPEFIISKMRDSTGDWKTYLGGYYLRLNSSAQYSGPLAGGTVTPGGANYVTLTPNSGDVSAINNPSSLYYAYLFATLAGVSKCGVYTGNGGALSIDCGFSNGARFILIKRLDGASGDWYIWDTTRGIVASGNDPHFSLNQTIAEVTTDSTIEPLAAGFTVLQVAATNVNVTGANYQYLAIS